MVTFLFSVHTVTDASNKQGGARAVDLLATHRRNQDFVWGALSPEKS